MVALANLWIGSLLSSKSFGSTELALLSRLLTRLGIVLRLALLFMALIVAAVSLFILVVSKVSIESTLTNTFILRIFLHGLKLRNAVAFSIFPNTSLAITLAVSCSLRADVILAELGFSRGRSSRFTRSDATALELSGSVVSQLLSSLAILGVLLNLDIRLSVSGEHLARLP